MLRGGCLGVDGRLLDGVGLRRRWRLEELAPEVLQVSQRVRRHRETPPALGCPVEDGPDEREAALLARQAADDLHPPSRLAEGPLDEVGMPDALMVLGGEGQEGEQRFEVVLDAGDRREIEALPRRDELASALRPSASALSPEPSILSKIAQ